MLVFACLAAVYARPGVTSTPYTLVADAGSTGTRMYLFHLTGDEGKEQLDVKDLGKGPALSSFQDNSVGAVASVDAQMGKAKEIIPEALWKDVPVMIFATAGMRLVDSSKAEAVYADLRNGLLNSNYPFDRESLQAKTISGREEGVFAFVAANYLAERISVDLQIRSQELMGVLDLGGSSTQIAVPPLARVGDAILPSLRDGNMYVKSFLSLGMERMRQLTFKTVVQQAHWAQRSSAQVSNPCSFTDYVEAGEVWRGTGDAVQCQQAIATVLRREASHCEEQRRENSKNPACLPMQMIKSAQDAAFAGVPRFFMISGYVFVVDFARWWLSIPEVLPKASDNMAQDEKEILNALAKNATYSNPTLKELRAAAAVLCAGPWAKLSAAASSSRHKFTPEKKAPHRCFELNYIITLLSVGYGFPEDSRPFQYVDAIGGRDVEWSLGAFLLSRSTSPVNILEGTAASSFQLQIWTWQMAALALLAFAGIVTTVRRRCTNQPCIPATAGDGGKQV